MAKAKYTVVARIESEDGSGISSWVKVGFAIPGKHEGEINVKLQTLPIMKDCWDGWLYIRESEEPEQKEEKFRKRARAKRNEKLPVDLLDDDIPF